MQVPARSAWLSPMAALKRHEITHNRRVLPHASSSPKAWPHCSYCAEVAPLCNIAHLVLKTLSSVCPWPRSACACSLATGTRRSSYRLHTLAVIGEVVAGVHRDPTRLRRGDAHLTQQYLSTQTEEDWQIESFTHSSTAGAHDGCLR